MERSLLELIDSFNNDIDNDIDENEPRLFDHSPYYEPDDFIELFKSKKDIFNVFSVNCQSLNSKFNELIAYLKSFDNNECHVSAICLQETWIKNDTDTAYLEIPGYNFISYPSSCSTHGGVAIYLRECFAYKVLTFNNNYDIWDGLFIEVKLNNYSHSSLIIGNIYRPPRELFDNYKDFINDFERILTSNEIQRHEVIIVGDFNIDLLKMYDRPIVLKSSLMLSCQMASFLKLPCPPEYPELVVPSLITFFSKYLMTFPAQLQVSSLATYQITFLASYFLTFCL